MAPDYFPKYVFFVLMIFGLWFSACEREKGNVATTADTEKSIPSQVDFNFHIKPILSDRCFNCHGPDENSREAGLRFDTEAGAFAALGENKDHFAIVPGQPDSSTIIHRLTSKNPDEVMPPPASNLNISDYEVELIRKWIAQGAEWKKHWAFIPPQKTALPRVQKADWPRNPIDHFILARLEQEGLPPSAQASKETLIRRLSFDITGLPPALAEIDAFLNDASPNAYEKVVDRLLASPDYGERMAIVWLDAARYADSNGYQDDTQRTAWPWRDWVIHAFNKNLPFDAFTRWQLAGDLLPNPTLEQLVATSFNRNHKITQEGGVIDEEYRVEYVADRTQTAGTIFMGLTMECARCHDHKYDPISQKDYFEMFAFFNNVPEKGLIEYGKRAAPPMLEMDWDEALAKLDFVTFKDTLEEKFQLMVMEDMPEVRPSHILNRGQYDQPTTEVNANTLDELPPMPVDYPKNRLGFTNWLLSAENPLTARVTVNRFWQLLFGQGIVSTPDDFGNQGSLPTHPALLDWLAVTFQEKGWDMKQLIKTIVMSATYQQSSVASEKLMRVDPGNDLLARGPRYRLPAEMIRDNALSVSGLLVKKVGGPSVKPYQPKGLWEEKTAGGGYTTYVPDTGEGLYRKSLYTFWKRTVPPPSMITFDAPTRDLCAVIRQKTSTPLQALVLMNDPQILEASRYLAYRMMAEGGETLAEQLAYGFRTVISRAPDEQELAVLTDIFNEKQQLFSANPEKAKDLLSIGEAPAKEDFDPAETAAMTIVANMFFNMYESVTKI